ncbi:gluconate 5-dehydrogenase [Salmonella enterica subsp. enterica]|nr:gluconate 5-dehydrogenase [Salmonella enterica subsp. enterica] [Salmonella enterica subsp. enterica serovar Menston]
MNDLFSLAGKNILITGAAQGIGYLLATGLGPLWRAHYC